MQSSKEQEQIVIAGAGPAGVTASLFLSKAGIRHTVIDKAVFPRDKICGDALSGKVLQQLRLLNPQLQDELFASQDAFLGSWGVKFVAPNGEALDVPFLTNPGTNVRPPGYISKRIDFDNFLVSKVDPSTADFRQGHELKSITKVNGGLQLTICNGQEYTVQCKLLIAAEGAHSLSSKVLGSMQLDPKHHSAGIRAYYRGVTGMHEHNYIELHYLKEFLPGYLWVFPLPNGWANVGIGILSADVSRKKLNLKNMMLEAINNRPALKERFSNATLEGKILGWGLPLGSRKLQLSGDHFLLAGDAGSLIDPFTGEGIGNAMVSGRIAAEVAESAIREQNFTKAGVSAYDQKVYRYLGSEFLMSSRMQKLVRYPWLFNFVVRKANRNPTLKSMITSMFEDVDLRSKFRDPFFYLKLLLGK